MQKSELQGRKNEKNEIKKINKKYFLFCYLPISPFKGINREVTAGRPDGRTAG